MRIVQLLSPRPSEYERKSLRIDFQALRHDHEVIAGERVSADVTLIYGRPPVSDLPEAVEEEYFDIARPSAAALEGGGPALPAGEAARRYTIGSFRRRSIVPMVEQTMLRLHRTREDIEWLLIDQRPAPADFAQFDVWVDPAAGEDDLDGFVAEAQVVGKIVVAARTAVNIKRLEKGRTGLLVAPGDANELTHAILTALFKPEVAQQKIEAAKQTISKFHPRQRLRALAPLLTR